MSSKNISVYTLPWPENDVVHLTIEGFAFELDGDDAEFLIEQLTQEVDYGKDRLRRD